MLVRVIAPSFGSLVVVGAVAQTLMKAFCQLHLGKLAVDLRMHPHGDIVGACFIMPDLRGVFDLDLTTEAASCRHGGAYQDVGKY